MSVNGMHFLKGVKLSFDGGCLCLLQLAHVKHSWDAEAFHES